MATPRGREPQTVLGRARPDSPKSRRDPTEIWTESASIRPSTGSARAIEVRGRARGSRKGRVMVAGDLLRLAWEAEHDGRTRLRDSLMTLAIAESAPEDPWAERCRARLVLERPDHFFAHFATVGQALEDPRVLDARERLRVKYPPARVQSLLLRACARRGPYLGRVESLEAMIDDLAGQTAEAENVRRDSAQPSRGPTRLGRAGRSVAFVAGLSADDGSGLEASPARGPATDPLRRSGRVRPRAAGRGHLDLLPVRPPGDRLPAGLGPAIDEGRASAGLNGDPQRPGGWTSRVGSLRWRLSRVKAPSSRWSRAAIAASRMPRAVSRWAGRRA